MFSTRNSYILTLNALVIAEVLERAIANEAKYKAAKNGAYSKSVSSFGTFVPISSSE